MLSYPGRQVKRLNMNLHLSVFRDFSARTKSLEVPRRIFAILQPNSRSILRFLLYNSVTFIIARIHEESTHYYRHNFVSIIEEKVHPLLSPKSFVGIKFYFEFISNKTTEKKI